MGLPMGPVHLFDLAAQQARWLSARQVAVAENIANANTPGYRAADVPPFETVFNDDEFDDGRNRRGAYRRRSGLA